MIHALILSAALLTVQEAPAQIEIVNEPSEAAKAVYLADAAAKERGNRSEIAVLGTSHLRQSLPKDFDFKRFRPLIDKLVAWAPDRIAVESLSGHQCDYLRDYAFIHGDIAKTYCSDPAPARAAFGMTGPEAEAEIRRLLAEPATTRPAAERRRLAGLFLASGDPWSAMVQWLRLAPAERKAGDGLNDELVAYLDERSKRTGENTVIAIEVAVALGHERLYPVDDHACCRWSGDEDEEAYGHELQEIIWKNEWVEKLHSSEKGWTKHIIEDPKSNVIDWYRMLNTPERARRAVAGDFGAAAGADVPHNTGRKYLAYWEARNLRMAANIRDVIYDGNRVLAIVGAGHKAYYERYLGVISDLEIVNIETLLD